MGLIFRLVELLVVLVPLVGVAYATYRGIAARRQREPELPAAPPAVRPATAAQRRTVLRTIEQHDRTDTRWLEYELTPRRCWTSH